MIMSNFSLHPQLEKDTGFIADLTLCRLLRMKDKHYPWLILVPRQADIREIIDLPLKDQQVLLSEITMVSRLIRDRLMPTKINVAALGNMVPQLHIHVIARFNSDIAWPKPVWGAHPALPFESAEWIAEIERWRAWISATK